MSDIPPGERRELRAVVRNQMKVLRAEVKQREAELKAEIEARLAEKYREMDRRADELTRKIEEIGREADRQLADLIDNGSDTDGRWQKWSGFGRPRIYRKDDNRDQLRKALIAGVTAQVHQANLALNRQEADLLRDLSVDALESAAARAFLDRIPTVAELVPSRRLREIEAQFDVEAAP